MCYGFIIDGEELAQMKERNCSNCFSRNEKYKILACKIHNKQVSPNYCCPLHTFDDFIEKIEKKKV